MNISVFYSWKIWKANSLTPELSTVLILTSHISTRHWAGIQKSSFAVHAVVYNHSNPVRQCSMAAKNWLKNWKYYFFSPPRWWPRQNVFLWQILSALCALASQTGVTRHISKLAVKVWPLVFSFSISSKFRDYTLWTHCWAAREKSVKQPFRSLFIWVTCSSG